MASLRVFRQMEVITGPASRHVISAVEYVITGRVMTIKDLWTTNDYRRQGVASNLMDIAEADGKRQGCVRVVMEVPGDPGKPKAPTLNRFLAARAYVLNKQDLRTTWPARISTEAYSHRLEKRL